MLTMNIAYILELNITFLDWKIISIIQPYEKRKQKSQTYVTTYLRHTIE